MAARTAPLRMENLANIAPWIRAAI